MKRNKKVPTADAPKDIDMLVARIEKRSIAPEGHRQDGVGTLIDHRLMPLCFSECEVGNEDRITSRRLPEDVVHPHHRESEPVGDPYRLIHEDGVQLVDDMVCICGCTDCDCQALPAGIPMEIVNRRTRLVYNRMVQVFDIFLPQPYAAVLGII